MIEKVNKDALLKCHEQRISLLIKDIPYYRRSIPKTESKYSFNSNSTLIVECVHATITTQLATFHKVSIGIASNSTHHFPCIFCHAIHKSI